MILYFGFKALGLNIAAGDNPFLCTALVLIPTYSGLATGSYLNVNICGNAIRAEGGDDRGKKNQTWRNT